MKFEYYNQKFIAALIAAAEAQAPGLTALNHTLVPKPVQQNSCNANKVGTVNVINTQATTLESPLSPDLLLRQCSNIPLKSYLKGLTGNKSQLESICLV